jgi:transcriptional regulator with PAS, ATPase and Fis domain
MQSLPPKESAPGKHNALESVNKELENAIEQMRLANQALLATQQELHSLTNLVESMQQEIELLNHEVVRLRSGYADTLDHVPYPVLLADKEGRVAIWNHAAQQMFNLEGDDAVGKYLCEMPVQPSLRQILTRKHQAVVERGNPLMLKNQPVQVKPALYRMDVHFASVSDGVLVVFRDGPAALGEQHKINLVGSFAS